MTKYVIISGELSSLDYDTNKKRSKALESFIKDILNLPYVECQGRYKDVFETSFKVTVLHPENISQLKLLAIQYEQESILLISGKGKAKLLFIENDEVPLHLGKYTKVNEWEYLDHESGTYEIETGEYYVCK